MTTIAKRLQQLIDRKNINQGVLSDKIGIERSNINRVLNGKTKNPQRATLRKIADYFGCDINWLADGNGEPFPEICGVSMTQHIGNVAGHVQQVHGDFHGNLVGGGHPAAPAGPAGAAAGQKRQSRLADLHAVPVIARVPESSPPSLGENIESYLTFPDAPPDSFAIKVAGDAMAPGIIHGDYVLFVIHRQAAVGDIVVVNDEYGESMLRRLREKSGDLYLVSDNPTYPTYPLNDNYRIMGVVVDGFRRLKF